MLIPGPQRVLGSTPTVPTGGLVAQYDASDTANHNAASGLLSPTAGSSSIDLQCKDSGGNDSFSYSGTLQAGMAPIAVPTTNWFVPVSSGSTYAAGITTLFAYRLNTRVDGPVNQFTLASGNFYLRFPESGKTTLVFSSIGTACNLTLTGLNAADGSFQIIGFVQRPDELAFLASDRSGDSLSVNSLSGTSSAPYLLNTSNVIADLCDIDWCELLLYSGASPGTLLNAMNYLSQKWNPA